MADLAGLYLLVEGFEGFLQWCVFAVLVAIAELAEVVGRALWPVQLVEVDPIGLQALEAGIQRFGYMRAVVFELTVADIADAIARAGDLAGQHPVSTITTLFEVVTDDLFGLAVGFCARRYRVHLGGIDEIYSVGLGAFNLGEALARAVLFAPGHGTQAQTADL